MPRFDGTGPKGLGPLTGRGMGYCAVRLPPSGTEGRVSMNADPVSVGQGFSYPYQGTAHWQEPQLSRFVLGAFPFRTWSAGGFRRGWTSQPRRAGFGR